MDTKNLIHVMPERHQAGYPGDVGWGVRRPDGDDPGEAERKLYRVTVQRPDGSSDEINPFALAELEDRDNNHFLCLDTADPAVAISFPAGHLVDPNKAILAQTAEKVH